MSVRTDEASTFWIIGASNLFTRHGDCVGLSIYFGRLSIQYTAVSKSNVYWDTGVTPRRYAWMTEFSYHSVQAHFVIADQVVKLI